MQTNLESRVRKSAAINDPPWNGTPPAAHGGSIDLAIAELKKALSPGQSCHIEADVAELIERDFSLEARIRRAVRLHKPRKHLRRYQIFLKVEELAA